MNREAAPATASAPSTAPPDPAAGVPGDVPAQAEVVRYRCAGCGNLTRFDIVTQRRTREFHHFSVGGELVVEDVEVLEESVEGVSCRWCGHGDAIEVLGDGETAAHAADE